jgi:hypothetical protein
VTRRARPIGSAMARVGCVAAVAAGAACAWAATPQVARAQSPAGPLESEFMMDLVLDVSAQLQTGDVSIAPITGGTFSGPGIKGTVRPGGADYITQSGGHSNLDVRIVLETDDGALIYMTYTGVVARGDGGTYWRVRPVFHTTSEKYAWMNNIVAVGKSKSVPGKVAYDIFRIL